MFERKKAVDILSIDHQFYKMYRDHPLVPGRIKSFLVILDERAPIEQPAFEQYFYGFDLVSFMYRDLVLDPTSFWFIGATNYHFIKCFPN